MSAAARWAVPTRAFETSLAELKRWREATAEALAAFRRWAMVGRIIDEQAAARLAHLERRLAHERLTIAFVGEPAAGKSDLINALFFAEARVRLLPPGVRCAAEVLWDSSLPPAARMLPIETRASGKSLRDCFEDPSLWTETRLDLAEPEEIARTCATLADTIELDAATAAEWGIATDASARVPRWRYATINIPQPLLASGIALLDTGDAAMLEAEPELTFHRLPDAAAVVFTVSAESGVTQRDLRMWTEHVAPIAGMEHTCFVAVNRGSAARDDNDTAEAERQARGAAEVLRAEPVRVFSLAARPGFAAKVADDREAVLRSRVYRLEQALARGIGHQRRLDHATAVRAEAHGVFAETRTLLESRLGFMRDQVAELVALQDKNQQLVQRLAKKASVDRGRIELARGALGGLRAAHNRNADELDELLSVPEAQKRSVQAREAVAATRFSRDIAPIVEQFFRDARERLQRAIAIIDEEKHLMKTAARKFSHEYQIGILEVAEFGTMRFLTELARLEEHWGREAAGRTTMLLRSGKSLGAQFFDGVGVQVAHIFEIADRETKTWMQGFLRPLEQQIAAYQDHTNARIEGMGRIQNAETDLIARLEELRRLAAQLQAQRDDWQAHHDRVMALIEPQRRPT